MEFLERVDFSPTPEPSDRLAVTVRIDRAARRRVAIDPRQHNAGQADRSSVAPW